MPNGRRNVSYARRFTAGGLTAIGAFVISVGAGMKSWQVAAVGAVPVVLAVGMIVISAVGNGARSYVRGTAHVLAATRPPANVAMGRCEMQIVVEAEGLVPVRVKITDARVPVARWPDVGDTLPVRVPIEDPRQVRVLWDEVPTHAERAAEDERFHDHVRRIVDADQSSVDDTLEYPTPLEPAAGEPRGQSAVPRPRARPRPRPSPRPRRPADGATTVAVAEPAEGAPTASHPGSEVVPAEGASATEADDEAVRDMLAALPSTEPGATGAIQGAGVTLIVADLARTIDFYRDKLGFQVLDRGDSSAVLSYGQTRLAVRCVPDMPRVDRRLVQLNLEVSDLEAAYAELRAKGVKFIHPPRPVTRGERMELWAAMLRDPDSHGIALITWRELS